MSGPEAQLSGPEDQLRTPAPKSGRRATLLRWSRLALVPLLVLLPVLLHEVYRLTRQPQLVRMATGPAGGRYRVISKALVDALESRTDITITMVESNGSQDNLRLLQRGEIDFGLYQQSAWEQASLDELGDIAFVANLYQEPLHLIVRRAAGIGELSELRGRSVNLGLRATGDYGVSRSVLRHLGISEHEIDARYLTPEQTRQALLNGELDAAFVTMGMATPFFDQLFAADEPGGPGQSRGGKSLCELRALPNRDAMTLRHFFLSPFTIPAATYRGGSSPVPAHDLETVSSTAQLLTRTAVDADLVLEMTRLVHDQAFQKANRLRELFLLGTSFSAHTPEFPLHPGARRFYEPEPRPLLSPDFVESTEGIRSFLVSLVVAVFFLYRWQRRRRARRKEHQLDSYVRALLDIERRQVQLDGGCRGNDIEALHRLLQEVTQLRQDALSTFSVHQLQEDRGVDCFTEMCHALSNKINAKLTRQRFDAALGSLQASITALRTEPQPTDDHNHTGGNGTRVAAR